MRCKIGVLSIGLMKEMLQKEISSMNLNADFIFSDTMLWTDSKLPEEVSHADVFFQWSAFKNP